MSTEWNASLKQLYASIRLVTNEVTGDAYAHCMYWIPLLAAHRRLQNRHNALYLGRQLLQDVVYAHTHGDAIAQCIALEQLRTLLTVAPIALQDLPAVPHWEYVRMRTSFHTGPIIIDRYDNTRS